MDKTKKRAFTIVELVIVIAVIAILAAVLIALFMNLIKKANKSADMQLIRNLNTALTTDAILNGKHTTMQSALDAAEKNGYILEKINATATQSEIIWDSKNDMFCYLNDDGTIEYLPEANIKYPRNTEDSTTYISDKVNDIDYFVISSEISLKYSTYLYNYTGPSTLEITKGLDVGKITTIASIKYSKPDKQSVIIRSNGGTLTIDAALSTVYHYGFAEVIDVNNVDNSACYHEGGRVGRLIYNDNEGKIFFESSAVVYCYMNTSSDTSANASDTTKAAGAIVYTYVDSGTNQAKGYVTENKEQVTVTNGLVEVSSCKNHNEDYDVVYVGNDVYLVCKCCGAFSKISTGASGTTTITNSEGVNEGNNNTFSAENVEVKDAVATIGYSKYYSTLAAAVADAKDGDTITMLKNHTTAEQTFSKTLTLDLNGKAVSGTGVLLTFNGTGSFTVKDSSINGSITSSQVAVKNSGTGTVVIDGGTLTAPDNKQNYGINNTAAGTIIVNKGLVSGQFGIYNSALGATIRVNGGEIRGGSKSGIFCLLGKGDVIITGGTVTSTSEYGICFSANSSYNSKGQGSLIASGNASISGTYGIYSGNPSTINISGNATVTGSGNYGIYLYNTSTIPASITINDSAKISGNSKSGVYVYTTKAVNTLTVNDNAEVTGLSYGIYDYNGNVTINGGNIAGTSYGISATSSTSAVNINGGTIAATSYAVYNQKGTVTMTGGKITSGNTGILTYANKVSVSGGLIDASAYGIRCSSGKTVVTLTGDCDVHGELAYGVYNDNTDSEIYVKESAKVSATLGAIWNSGGNLDISGGRIVAEGAPDKKLTCAIYHQGVNLLKISGEASIVNNNSYSYDPELDENGEVIYEANGSVKIKKQYIPFGIYALGNSNQNATVTINGGSISAPNDGFALDLRHTDAIITNGTLSGANAIVSSTYDSTCTISDGTFNATGSQVCYAQNGKFTISGGIFTGGGSSNPDYASQPYRFTLNCLDDNRITKEPTEDYPNPNAWFYVTGGSFYQFNPEDDLSEGENTCFTLEGYHTKYNDSTGYYTVVANN